MAYLEIKNLTKSFDTKVVLDNVSLNIEKGDIYGILGLSGAGKSTLVRCINGLEKFDSGEILIDGSLIKFDKPFYSKVAMIFQSFNLLQQKNVLENVLFPSKIHKIKDSVNKAKELLNFVGLSDKLKAYPSQLSGGQQQRVAIARALMTDPEILLCDEATSALDPSTTESVLSLLKDINKTTNMTIIIISHQMSVIESICNKVAIIDNSHIVEDGFVNEVFLSPKSDIGKKLVYSGKVSTDLSQDKLIKLIFDGNVDEPIITNIVQECNMLVSIVMAESKVVHGRIYGQILFKLPYYQEDIERLCTYLNSKGIKYEEVLASDLE